MALAKIAFGCACIFLQFALPPSGWAQTLSTVQSRVHDESIVGHHLPTVHQAGVYHTVIGGWSEIDAFTLQAPGTPLSLPKSNGRFPGGGSGNSSGGGSALPAPPAIGRFNEGFLLGTAVGLQLNQKNRFEAEGVWRSNSGRQSTSDTTNASSLHSIAISGHLNNYAGMFNLLHDFNPAGVTNFYGGLGIGVSRIDGQFDSRVGNVSLDDWLFAYQAIAGMKIRANNHLSLNVEYRYFGNSETEIEATAVGKSSFDYIAENIVFGVSFTR